MKESTKRMLDYFSRQHRFHIKTKHSSRLLEALRITNKSHLVDITLVNEEIHRLDSKYVANLLIEKWKILRTKTDRKNRSKCQIQQETGIKIPKINPQDILNNQVRFLTLLDSVSEIDAKQALSQAKRMKDEIVAIVNVTKGISLIGCIEAAVIPIHKILEEAKSSNQDSFYKLDGIKILAKASGMESAILKPEASVFLIHFHGVVFANNSTDIQAFNYNLKQICRWNIMPRQIEFKQLYRENSVEDNLKNIATYISKGTNSLKNGKYNFKYGVKPSCPEDFDAISAVKNKSRIEDDAFLMNSLSLPDIGWKIIINKDGIEELVSFNPKEELEAYPEDFGWKLITNKHGIEEWVFAPKDTLSLSAFEISEQVQLIDYLMDLDSTRTGYLIHA
jgi:hypothetical protein